MCHRGLAVVRILPEERPSTPIHDSTGDGGHSRGDCGADNLFLGHSCVDLLFLKVGVVVVEEHGHGLADDAERHPKGDVAGLDLLPEAPSLLEHLGDGDEGDLAEHCPERVEARHVKGHRHEQLVQKGREEEAAEHCGVARGAGADAGKVEVSDHPIVYREVPELPVLLHRGRVPPLAKGMGRFV